MKLRPREMNNRRQRHNEICCEYLTGRRETNANNAVLDYKGTNAANTGEILPDTEVTMPENTAYFRLACDLGVNSTQFKAYKLTLSREE